MMYVPVWFGVCAAPAQPLGLSSLAILTIDLGTEVAPAISLSFEGEVSSTEYCEYLVPVPDRKRNAQCRRAPLR